MKDNGKNLSRRSFLKGGAWALGGLVAGSTLLTGCKNPDDHLKSPEDVEQEKKQKDVISDDWLGTPPEIADSKIAETLEADVVIVGAGVAGINAARAAAEAGASAIVVEKAATWQCRF